MTTCRGRDGWRWWGSFLLVLSIHGVVAVGVFLGGAFQAVPSSVPMDAVMLTLAPLAEAPASQPTELAPGPAQQRSQPAWSLRPSSPARKILRLPEQVADVAVPSTAPEAPDARPEPEESLPPVVSEEDALRAHVNESRAPPDVKAAASQRLAAPVNQSGNPAGEAQAWQGRLLAHLQRFRRYPPRAERRQLQGVVYVRFAVNRRGDVSGVRLHRGSGHELLDQAGMETVQRATPVPPPPPELEGDPLDVVVPVEFFIRQRG